MLGRIFLAKGLIEEALEKIDKVIDEYLIRFPNCHGDRQLKSSSNSFENILPDIL